MNWETIRYHYASTDLTAGEIAARFRVKPEETERRMEAEKWEALRRRFHRRNRSGPGRLRQQRVDALTDALLTYLEQAAGELDLTVESFREKTKTDTGEIVREYSRPLPGEPGAVDRGGLKQLTAVLKDIKDLMVLRTDTDIREQLARIAKLERDLQTEEPDTLIVRMEGEPECYAD